MAQGSVGLERRRSVWHACSGENGLELIYLDSLACAQQNLRGHRIRPPEGKGQGEGTDADEGTSSPILISRQRVGRLHLCCLLLSLRT